MSEYRDGEGQTLIPKSALSDILHPTRRWGFSESEVLDEAINALAEVALAIGEVRQLTLPSNAWQARPQHTDWSGLSCEVRYLNSKTLFDWDTDTRYLLDGKGRLLPIEDVRIAREFNHYRVTLVGSTVQIPVLPSAEAYVSNQPLIAGKTLHEVQDARKY